jgi:outer membrane phospholipase A
MPQITKYKGYFIVLNLYGRNEYTVQYNGDDLFFRTLKGAKDFIDEILE